MAAFPVVPMSLSQAPLRPAPSKVNGGGLYRKTHTTIAAMAPPAIATP